MLQIAIAERMGVHHSRVRIVCLGDRQPVPQGALLTRFVTKMIRGVSVLVHEGDGVYRADNNLLQNPGWGMAYRRSANEHDKDLTLKGLKWGATVTGVDEGDFVRVQIAACY